MNNLLKVEIPMLTWKKSGINNSEYVRKDITKSGMFLAKRYNLCNNITPSVLLSKLNNLPSNCIIIGSMLLQRLTLIHNGLTQMLASK